MNAEQAQMLRAEFPASAVGKLPKPKKKDNPKGRCAECGGWHGLPAVHLDYVGHAATTDRLLQVDPEWTWEPMGRDAHGNPAVVSGLGDPAEPIGLWITLTVCGVSRPGFGSGRSAKEAIGDAIRNAAMRFGVALDLWAKEDLHGSDGSEGGAGSAPPPRAPAARVGAPPSSDTSPAPDAARGGGFQAPEGATERVPGGISEAQVKRLWAIVNERKVPHPEVKRIVVSVTGQERTHGIKKGAEYDAVIAAIQGYEVAA